MHDMTTWTRPEPGSGRVLFPPVVDPRESLVGLVLRTATDNVHSNVGTMLGRAGYPHARAFDLAEDRLELVGDLAAVLGVRPDVLKPLVHPQVSRGNALRTISFLGAEVPDYDVAAYRRRISPTTLGIEPFHRAVWTHALLPYCPHSLELLVDACPRCGTKLGWSRANGIDGCGDGDCGLRPIPPTTTRLGGEVAEPYRRMAALAGPGDRAVEPAALHGDLENMDPGAVFELGWRLACTLAPLPKPRRHAKHLPAALIVETLVSADRIICGWPDHFHAMLMARMAEDGPKVTGATLLRLRKAAAPSGAWPQINRVLRTTYADLMAKGRGALRSLDRGIVSGTTANAMLGISSGRFANLKRSPGLPPLVRTGTKRLYDDFHVSEIKTIAEARDASMSGRTVAERLGIAFHGVEQAAALLLLETERHPALAVLDPGIRITTRSLDDLLDRIRVGSAVEVEDGVTIRCAVKSIPGEKPWGVIIAAMLDGRIRYRIVGPGRPFENIIVHAADVPLFRSFRFDRAAHPSFGFASDMTKRDAEEALNLTPRLLPVALREECGSGEPAARITVAEVARIAAARISAAEIYARTAPGSRRHPPFLKASGLRRAGVAGWVRTEVESLMTADRNPSTRHPAP